MNCFRHYDAGDMNREVILFSNGCPYGKRKGKEAAGISTPIYFTSLQICTTKMNGISAFGMSPPVFFRYHWVFEVKKYN